MNVPGWQWFGVVNASTGIRILNSASSGTVSDILDTTVGKGKRRMNDKCICCGEILREGMSVCPNCLVFVKQQDEIDFDYAAEDDNA